MQGSTGGWRDGVMSFVAIACLSACASSGAGETSVPTPEDMQRGWRIHVYRADGAIAGVTTLPQHPADRTRPEEILASIPAAFCTPVLDRNNEASDEQLRGFCGAAGREPGRARVVLAPAWSDDVPSHPYCFIHCVCEGHSPRGDDQTERARESPTGPCTNRLNCRLDCP